MTAKHVVVLKCNGDCPYNKRNRWNSRNKRVCYAPNERGYSILEEIPKGDFKGKLFPEFCPLEDYDVERCDKIQLKKKKMQDHIKRRKRCRK